MDHDSNYFRQRAAEARATAYSKDSGDAADVAGDLALAYSALARRQATPPEDDPPAIPLDD